MNNFTPRPEIIGNFGVVTSTHWIATAVGMSLLEKKGNAFDAAVATGFTLQVVEPHLNGPGGEVPIIICPTNKKPIISWLIIFICSSIYLNQIFEPTYITGLLTPAAFE